MREEWGGETLRSWMRPSSSCCCCLYLCVSISDFGVAISEFCVVVSKFGVVVSKFGVAGTEFHIKKFACKTIISHLALPYSQIEMC